MPSSPVPARVSRRDVLAALTATATPALAGCWSSNVVTGFVQVRAVEGSTVDGSGGTTTDQIVRVETGDSPADDPEVEIAEPWRDEFVDPDEPTVSRTLHEVLSVAYGDLTYVVGVCSPAWADAGEDHGCVNAAVGRESFNRVRVGDEVRVSHDDSGLTIHGVTGDWKVTADAD